MIYYSCFDKKGEIIARCQTKEDIEVLKKMGRPIVEVKEMKNEESIFCSLTGSPSDYNEDYQLICLTKGFTKLIRILVLEATTNIKAALVTE